jgi:putative ABC transport system permease protein
MLPDAPFVYFFVDQRIDRFYKGDRQLRDVLGLATGLAFFIACMGMYGLVFLSVAQRVKEIGIRKVLGASIKDIAVLFARDAVKWVLIANVLAWPIAYYFIDRWLSDFAYRTAVSPWIFILSGIFALVVALVTISSHAIRAAMANPMESLRYE